MSKPADHKLDIYGTELHLALDTKAWATLRRRHPDLRKPSDLGYGETVDSRERATDQQHIWIYVAAARAASEPDLVETVAHEAAHVAEMILTALEIPATEGNGEPFAYLAGWVSGWIWRHVKATA